MERQPDLHWESDGVLLKQLGIVLWPGGICQRFLMAQHLHREGALGQPGQLQPDKANALWPLPIVTR